MSFHKALSSICLYICNKPKSLCLHIRYGGKTAIVFAKISDIVGSSVNLAKAWHHLLLKDSFIEKIWLSCMACCRAMLLHGLLPRCPPCCVRRRSVTRGQRAERVVRESGERRGKNSRGKLYRSITAPGRYNALLSCVRLIDPDFGVYTRALTVSSKLG